MLKKFETKNWGWVGGGGGIARDSCEELSWAPWNCISEQKERGKG